MNAHVAMWCVCVCVIQPTAVQKGSEGFTPVQGGSLLFKEFVVDAPIQGV